MPDIRKLPILHRDVEIVEAQRAEGEGAPAPHKFSVSSETPVEFWFGTEILQHDENSIDKKFMRGGLPVMVQDVLIGEYGQKHVGVHIGIFENARIENRKLVGDVRYSASQKGADTKRDVEDKIRKQVSLGYRVLKAKVTKGEAGTPDVWTATKWMPIEVTILPLGADISVGPQMRGEDQSEYEVEIETDGPAVPQEESTMPPEVPSPQPAGARTAVETTPPPAQPAASVTVTSPTAPAPERNRNEEVAEILSICESNGLSARAPEFIRQGFTPQQVGYEIVKARKTVGDGQPGAEEVSVRGPDMGRYSYARALRLSMEHKHGGKAFDGLEGEVHQEILKNAPVNYQSRGGILVPMRTQLPQRERALDTKTAGAGAELVQDRPGELIEMLRTRAMVARMGARILTGLTAPIPFAKQVSGMTMYWVGENPTQDVPDSDIGTGLVTLSPHTIMGMGIFGKQLLAESSIDVEEMIRQELGGAGARGMDRATVHGTGTNGEPTGIYVAPDVQVLDVNGVPDYGDLVDMQAMVADKDADVGSLGYMTTPLMAGVFKKTLEFSAAGSTKIWMGTFEEGEVAGYRATATNQVSKVLGTGADEHGLLYGNWNTVVIGFWNATEITVDPFTLMARAMVRIASFQMGDVILRHPQSFTKGTRCKIAA